MRLVDADEIVKKINEIYKGYMTEEYGSTPCDFEAIVDETPTAYDIDKVVEELKDLGSKYCINVCCDYECKDCEHGIFMQKAIEIVKQGFIPYIMTGNIE